MIEMVLELLFELVFQVVLEGLAEVGLAAVASPFQSRDSGPLVAFLGYTLYGAVAGWISLLLIPELLVSSLVLQWLNLGLTPLIVGFLMAALGSWRASRDQAALRLDTFLYGAWFALVVGIIRFLWAGDRLPLPW